MFLYVVRHGQSESNLRHAHSGQDAVSLTRKGFEDAAKAGERLEGICFDRVYSSDQTRAMQTAQIALPSYSAIPDKRIREIDVGSLTGRLIDECRAEYGQLYDEVISERRFSAFGGEDHKDQYARVASFLKMTEELNGCENVAVFTHGGVVRCIFEYAVGIRMTKDKFSIDNGAVTVFEFRDGAWKMCLR